MSRLPRRGVAVLVAVAAAMGAAAAPAGAHVTLEPAEAPAGTSTVLAVRVPNEQDNARTTKVEVRLPNGLLSVSTEPVPGWKATTRTEKLAKPIKIEGVDVNEQVAEVTFTATGKGIGAGEFQDFPVAMTLPDKAGTKLTFKALQTYSNGDVTRWIGAPDSQNPAPQVALTAAGRSAPATPAATAAATAARATASAASKADDDGGSGTGLAIAALVAALVALGLAAAGFVTARRARVG